MKYVQPVGAAENAPYVGRSLASGGSAGSRVPAAAIEAPQREIVNAVSAAGLDPASGDLTQLGQAARLLARQAVDRMSIAGIAAAVDTQYMPGATLPGGAFARASTATWYDAKGALQTAANDVARFTADPVTGANRGLLIEGARTNALLNSAAPATQTVALAAGSYCLWIDGTGSATASGSAAGVATAGAPFAFTLAAPGSVTVTIAGAPTRVQLENGLYPTSFIPTTSAAVTRAADLYSESAASWLNGAEGTFYVSFHSAAGVTNARVFSLSDGTLTNALDVNRISAGAVFVTATIASVALVSTNTGAVPPAGVNRFVLTYTATAIAATLNGVQILNGPGAGSLAALTTFKFGRANNNNQSDAGMLRRAYFPRAVSADVAKRMTMP